MTENENKVHGNRSTSLFGPQHWIHREFTVIEWTREGKVTLHMQHPLTSAEKGHLLLEMEKQLRKHWHPQAEVFLEAKTDLNVLRQRLRGVKV